ncbi:ribosomal protein S2, flavodoxin-like domain-containing protein [Gorgonomyces haynaldii]|nr:ribosomal protein S2, flavodoxin-like domain-containing protein [Gorgonomyces haynaldii]
MFRRFSSLIPKAKPIVDFSRHSISIEQLMAANLHLGHSEFHPRMVPYIYGTREGINIINLDHTVAHLRRAASVVFEVAKNGGNVLFLGTKPMLHKTTVEAAQKAGQYFVIEWIGGTITNKERVLRRSVGYDPDKERKAPQAEKPDLLIVLDYPNNHWAVREANIANVPVIAICDTDCDPTKVHYPIPANDDSLEAVELIANVLASAAREGSELSQNV